MQRNRYITKNQLRAFTLVEVLIVIAIISILMTIAAIGIGNLSAGKGTATAIATTESLFDEARSIAVSKRCKARVMIDIDDPTDDRYLRRVVIAHERIDDTGNVVANEWVLSSRGYVMPQGTFFSKEYSVLKDGSKIPEIQLTGTNVTADFQGKYAYYEFNAEGIFLQPGASFILGTGIRQKGETSPKVTKSAQKDFAGFTIWRNGRTSTFRTLVQMGLPDSPTNF
jgi:prepilin-type N-terminal cleavage/methylation domain-containing protein